MRSARGPALLLFWLLGTPAAAAELPPELAEIATCLEANAPRQSARLEAELSATDRAGLVRSIEIEVSWKRFEERSKVVMRVAAPRDLRGTAVLMVQQAGGRSDLFSYLPALDKVRRVSTRAASSGVFGSDFSYEDLERLHNQIRAGETRRLADGESAGRPAYVLESRPADGESSYTRVLSHVDRERCVPIQVEFYESEDRVHKRLQVPPESVKRVGDSWIPHALGIADLRNETRSSVRVEAAALDLELPDRDFSEASLGRRR